MFYLIGHEFYVIELVVYAIRPPEENYPGAISSLQSDI